MPSQIITLSTLHHSLRKTVARLARFVTTTPEVDALLDQNAVVAIGVSGGKDSRLALDPGVLGDASRSRVKLCALEFGHFRRAEATDDILSDPVLDIMGRAEIVGIPTALCAHLL